MQKTVAVALVSFLWNPKPANLLSAAEDVVVLLEVSGFLPKRIGGFLLLQRISAYLKADFPPDRILVISRNDALTTPHYLALRGLGVETRHYEKYSREAVEEDLRPKYFNRIIPLSRRTVCGPHPGRQDGSKTLEVPYPHELN